jgi:hypothetical protein
VKFLVRHLKYATVLGAMARDFVPGVSDASYEMWELFGHPTKHEKGALVSGSLKKFNRALGIRLYPARISPPISLVDVIGERAHVEVVLDVKRYSIAHMRFCPGNFWFVL